MSDLKLNFLYIETDNTNTFGIKDISTYPSDPFINLGNAIAICVPGFGVKTINTLQNVLKIIDSTTLKITTLGCEQELPDGIYKIKYIVDYYEDIFSGDLAKISFLEKTIFRTNKIQELFDEAFLKLELSECNTVLKKQALVNLRTIETFIQTAIASANNCSEKQALTLYTKAKRMLEKFTTSECGCN